MGTVVDGDTATACRLRYSYDPLVGLYQPFVTYVVSTSIEVTFKDFAARLISLGHRPGTFKALGPVSMPFHCILLHDVHHRLKSSHSGAYLVM